MHTLNMLLRVERLRLYTSCSLPSASSMMIRPCLRRPVCKVVSVDRTFTVRETQQRFVACAWLLACMCDSHLFCPCAAPSGCWTPGSHSMQSSPPHRYQDPANSVHQRSNTIYNVTVNGFVFDACNMFLSPPHRDRLQRSCSTCPLESRLGRRVAGKSA